MKKIKLKIDPKNPRALFSAILVVVVLISWIVLVIGSQLNSKNEIARIEKEKQKLIEQGVKFDKNGKPIKTDPKDPNNVNSQGSEDDPNSMDGVEPGVLVDGVAPKSELFVAISKNEADAVYSMIKGNRALVNTLDETTGATPLQYAVLRGNYDIVRFLLNNSADVNSKGNTGRAPLHLAAFDGNEKIAKLLIDYKAQINAADVNGATPLIISSGRRHTAVAKLLLKQKAKLNEKEKESGLTALHAAVLSGDDEMVRELLQKGANRNIKDASGMTPLELAESMQRTENAKMEDEVKAEIKRYRNILATLKLYEKK